jgi:hypothetical protein
LGGGGSRLGLVRLVVLFLELHGLLDVELAEDEVVLEERLHLRERVLVVLGLDEPRGALTVVSTMDEKVSRRSTFWSKRTHARVVASM